ncbi:MAG: CPBP family intramembrane metalloprotease [Candidatus Cloacimonetes bacterium]|nr:CPBP family intramembrane metalloprotease [Candidatus Cloacimonadota bacterium]
MLGFAIGKFLPYMLIMLTIAGASVIASDLVSGEKERGTLETILVSAAGRNELVIGKYLTIITISMITVLLNLFSMYLSFSHILTQSSANISELQFPISNFILILFLMIPLITFFSALLLSVSTYSRNIKEAQSYQMPIMFGGMILSMVSFLPGFELNFGFALIPIVNFSLLLRDIMLGSYVLKLLIITVMSMLILDVIVVTISVKLFNNESVLFRTAEEKSLKFWGKDKKNVFSVQFGILLFIIILFLIFYVGGRWQTESLINGLIKTELLIILAPAIIVLRLSKTNFKESFRMNYTKPVNFLLVLLMAIPVYLIATFFMQLVNFIYPIPETYLQNLEKLISIPDISIWMSLFIIAVLPGICEEILFRGYFMNVFKKHGFRNSIIITGILFGILHLDPFRMLPVTILGFWMGYLLLSTNSVFVPIFAHIINNSIALLLGKYGHQIPFLKNMIAEDRFPFWILIPAVIIFVVLLLLFRRINFGLTDKSNNYRSMIN